jgi:WD40 repeat protein
VIVVWNTATGCEQQRLSSVELGLEPCLAFDPAGQLLATDDVTGAFRVWDVETGQLAFPLVQTVAPLTGLAYSPDGRRLAVAAQDDRVRLYDALLGHELLQFRCPGNFLVRHLWIHRSGSV